MTFSGVDWTILWKLHHVLFFWIYFTVGIPIKAVLAWRLDVSSTAKTSSFALLASVVSSAFNTWFPILPLSCAFILINLAHAANANLSVPLVAVMMGVEAVLLDWVLFRVVMKKSVKGRAAWVLVANLLNASIALALSLAWVVHHPTMMIAIVNGLG
ncbi:MAG: hypothetical protein WAM04_09530 [Candidatus Sulfotelmatobacter sp.]